MSQKENKSSSMGMVCDNSGAEFLNDLMLCDFLLKYEIVDNITLHVKLYPTYVSDVTIIDVDRHLSHLYVQSLNDTFNDENRKQLKDLYQRLTEYIKSNKMILKDHHFWNSGDCFDKIPKDLNDNYFKNNCIVIFKGDANYRRLVLAKMWNPSISFDKIIGSYFVTNAVTLRTMKSDCAIGIDKEIVEKVEKEDPEWRSNGKRGVISAYIK